MARQPIIMARPSIPGFAVPSAVSAGTVANVAMMPKLTSSVRRPSKSEARAEQRLHGGIGEQRDGRGGRGLLLGPAGREHEIFLHVGGEGIEPTGCHRR